MNEIITEIAKILNECCNEYDANGRHVHNKCNSYDCEYWSKDNHCCCSYNQKEAIALYNASYRKASDVARKIFEEIEKEIEEALKSNCKVLPQLEFSNEIYNSVRGKIDALRGLLDFIKELQEKKYTEEINNVHR